MARIRTIKPEFPQSESMGRVSRDARLCFLLLFTIADDEGKLRGNSRMLASLLFPYDDDAPRHINKWLDELSAQNCIVRYQIESDHYIKIINWLSHQKVDRPTGSKIPDPSEDSVVPREHSRALVLGSKDQGSRIRGSEDHNARVALSDLSVDHIKSWLAEKRSQGRYLLHDEVFILEQFKTYCESKGKTYVNYVAGYRNAFEWERCQPKSSSGHPKQSKWIAEGDRLAAKYAAQAEREAAIGHSPG